MKKRQVNYTAEAVEDLNTIFEYISEVASLRVAASVQRNLEQFIDGLEYASERGSLRNEVMQGLRVIGFKGRYSVAFSVDDENVDVLRVFWGGVNWEDEF